VVYNIDDKDVVEQLLTDFPQETEQCIPIALRTMIAVDYLPPVPFFSSHELMKYLPLLWKESDVDNKLIFASSNGLIYLVAYYLDHGAHIHAWNDAALREAALNDQTKTVELLLDREADIHANNDGALKLAATHGYIDTVKLLLDRKADLHASNDYTLRYAAAYGQTETVKLLLDNKANIHAINNYALKIAKRDNHTETVELLTKRMKR
jgi:ankyrin repeat protein